MTEEIEKITIEIPSAFEAHVKSDDPFQLIIRGHLWVESEIISIMTEYFAHPKEIRIDRLSFDAKLELAIALGLVSRHDKGAFRKLNALRNKLAHNLEAEITRKDEIDLFNALSKRGRFASQVKNVHETDFPGVLQRCIAVLYLSVQRVNEIIINSKNESFRLKIRVDEVLRKKTENAKYIDDLYFPNFLDHPSVMRRVEAEYANRNDVQMKADNSAE